MEIVKVWSDRRIKIPKDMIEKLNMRDTKFIYIVAYDSKTFFIKKQLGVGDITSLFVDIRLILKHVNRNSCINYRISIPSALMRKMPSIKIGGYVYVYINENKDIVVTTI